MSSSRMANSDEFKNELQRRLGKEEYERIGAEGHDRPNDRGQYDAAEVKSEFRNSDKSVEEMTEYYQGLADSGTKFNQRARDFLSAKGVTLGGGGSGGGDDDSSGGDDGSGSGGTTPTPTPTPTPSPTPGPIFPPAPTNPAPIFGTNTQTQTVNQDNDINSTVNGDNNSVSINQDNSVSQSMGSSDYASRFARGLKDQYILNLMNR